MSERLKTFIFFLVVFLTLLFMEISPAGFSDPDGYYHIKMAQILASGKFLTVFPWLTATTWTKSYADLHLLYHVLLIPFVKITPIVGAQVFNVICGLGFALVFYRIIKTHGLRYPKIWTWVMLFCGPGTLYRLGLVKAGPIALLLMFSFLYLLFKGNHKLLTAVAFLFVWTYGGFVYLPVLLLAFFVSVMVAKFHDGQNKLYIYKVFTKPALWAGAGIVFGVLLFPHFQTFLLQLYYQVFQAGLIRHIAAGDEWNPLSPRDIVGSYHFLLVVWLSSVFYIVNHWKKTLTDYRLLTLLLVSIFFFALSVRSQRFVQEAGPFMVLFSVFALNPLLEKYSFENLKSKSHGALRGVVPLLEILALVVFSSCFNIYVIAHTLHHPTAASRYQGVTQYLKNNSQPGDIVFNTYWDTFPQLFYFDSKNYYLSGMDPRFMYIADPKKYWLLEHVARDEQVSCPMPNCNSAASEPITQVPQSDFGVAYVLLEPQYLPKDVEAFKSSPNFVLVYSDKDFDLFHQVPSQK